MLTDLPKTLLVLLTSLPVGVAILLIAVLAYRCISHWRIAPGLVGAAMVIFSLAAAAVIFLGLFNDGEYIQKA